MFKARTDALKILDVDYTHLQLNNGDDLYITKFGLPYLELLLPDNYWLDKEWYNNNSLKLEGTSTIYKVKTKTINGRHKEFVLKWNRMGQDIPGVEDNNELINASFNSPFEEFSLVMELRNSLAASQEKVAIQKPLAIYVPKAHIELNRLGRKEYKIEEKISSHNDIALDKYRSYAVIYEWIKGIDAAGAHQRKVLSKENLDFLTMEGESRFNKNGFTVLDHKPEHVIVRFNNQNNLLKNKKGQIIFGMIDYELLERLPENEQKVKKVRRQEYLSRQKNRFKPQNLKGSPPQLSQVNIFGVDYIHGHVESTDGLLWVVGQDPYLFDYFLPERWKHSPKTQISKTNLMYHTVTKDNIHIVWKLSNVGKMPDKDPFKADEKKMLDFGFNSPFEEFALALKLSQAGLATVYPRAIYMKGKTEGRQKIFDESRYLSHQGILQKHHDYIVIWGYWNGPDDKLAAADKDYYRGVDILKAYKEGLVNQEQYFDFLLNVRSNLKKLGYEDLDLRGNHVMISLDQSGRIILDQNNKPQLVICNFEFIRTL